MEEFEKWFEKAKDDLKKAQDNFNIGNFDLSSFLCQQSVEKGLKAVLIKRTGQFPKIHDLVRLSRLVEIDKRFLGGTKELTLAYIYTRYPISDKVLDLKDKSFEFLKLNREIIKWVEGNL